MKNYSSEWNNRRMKSWGNRGVTVSLNWVGCESDDTKGVYNEFALDGFRESIGDHSWSDHQSVGKRYFAQFWPVVNDIMKLGAHTSAPYYIFRTANYPSLAPNGADFEICHIFLSQPKVWISLWILQIYPQILLSLQLDVRLLRFAPFESKMKTDGSGVFMSGN